MAKRSGIEVFMALADRAYKGVYTPFERTARLESAMPLPKLSGNCFKVVQSPAPHVNSVEVHGALQIDRLPRRRKHTAATAAAPRTGGIHVVMHSCDIFKFNGKPSLDTSFLYKSTVHLGYYESLKKNWRPLLYVRYDFAKANDAHPIFHAQLGTGELDGAVASIFDSVPEIVEPMQHVHQAVRLPSANVIGATALLSLAADHLPIKSFQEMLMAVQSQPFFSNWRCDCSSLDVADSATKLLSSGWYSGK